MSNRPSRTLAGLALGALLALGGPAVANAPLETPRNIAPLQPADALLVVKSERRLYLLKDGEPIRSYRIALGLNPRGHKEREGDFRTPEGRYHIYRRNPRSEFFLSLGISYPGENDVHRARQNGWPPGGAIMIHGLPNVQRRSAEYYASADWTDGCIALSNEDMLEVWLLTGTNTPIEIRP